MQIDSEQAGGAFVALIVRQIEDDAAVGGPTEPGVVQHLALELPGSPSGVTERHHGASRAIAMGNRGQNVARGRDGDLVPHRQHRETLGVRVWPTRDGKPLRDLVSSSFDVLALPLPWKHIEVEEGKYDWGPLDRWMEWASTEGKPIVAGPLVNF